jgi:hypothetical protein
VRRGSCGQGNQRRASAQASTQRPEGAQNSAA